MTSFFNLVSPQLFSDTGMRKSKVRLNDQLWVAIFKVILIFILQKEAELQHSFLSFPSIPKPTDVNMMWVLFFFFKNQPLCLYFCPTVNLTLLFIESLLQGENDEGCDSKTAPLRIPHLPVCSVPLLPLPRRPWDRTQSFLPAFPQHPDS